jgi:uncharacterized lipoprotein YddW (UPF0748 family)
MAIQQLSTLRLRKRHGALLLAGALGLGALGWAQYSDAAPRRGKAASRGSSPARRAAQGAASRLKKSPLRAARAVKWRAVRSQLLRSVVPAVGAPDYPPAVAREFRGVWVATVSNIDWPSKPGLPASQQKSEALAILDRAKALNMNAVIWQVRPMADAFYKSDLEPWSRYLSGAGKSPGYDPLEFVVEEAHKRGLELHAWFNPYRAGSAATKDFSPDHIARRRPELVKSYGKWLWMDPGNPKVREHTTRVVLDVVKRYDVDGIHLDDYFYPYVEKDAAGQAVPFPDSESYAKYLRGGGRLARDDWRRDNVNVLIRDLYQGIREEKSWVKFGISPFGIWRPGYPTSVKGMDAYSAIYADSRLWLREGWLDYWTPQLYWSLSAPAQGYEALLDWWIGQNVKRRHLWPGHNAEKIGAGANAFSSQEIADQIRATRARPEATGDVFFTAKSFARNADGVNDRLKQLYASPALVPATPWLDAKAPEAPSFEGRVDAASGTLNLSWKLGDRERVAQWAVQQRFPMSDGSFNWTTQVLAGGREGAILPVQPSRMPDRVALSAVDRVGNQSAPVVTVLR